MTCPYAVHIGVFLLGAEDAERDSFEQHLPSCHRCQTELSELANLPALLAAAKAAGEPMASGPRASDLMVSDLMAVDPMTDRPALPVHDLLDRVLTEIATERTTRDRHRRITLIAAVALILAGSLGGILYVLNDQPPTPTPVPVPVAGASSSFGVSAMTSVHPQPGGTRIDMTLSGLTRDTSCQLVAKATDGRTETAASWRVTYQDTVQVAGMTSISAAQLAELAVIDDDGRQLITIAMAPPEGTTQ